MDHAFWQDCARFVAEYPQRPTTLSRDAPSAQQMADLEKTVADWLPTAIPAGQWTTASSVGLGNWANVPWLAIFDARETNSAQTGSYPCLHFSSESPVGVRIGWGVSVTQYQGQAQAKAQAICLQLSEDEHTALQKAGFIEVANNPPADRVTLGASSLAKRYSQGMLYERFLSPDQLLELAPQLATDLLTLLTVYQAWVDRTHTSRVEQVGTPFLELMRQYADENVVFQSPQRDARYFISQVNATGCTIERLDSNKPERITAASYEARRDWLRQQGGTAPREALDNTVARHMTYLQAADLCLAADRRTACYLADPAAACQAFVQLILAMQTITLYKPVIVALVAEGIRDGELTQNRIEFPWLLDRFITRLQSFGQAVDEQQLAEGFARLAGDGFWLLAHHDPRQLLTTDKPSPSQIRARISHARLHPAFWNALQHPQHQQDVLDALQQKWWPDMKPRNVQPSPTVDFSLSDAVEALIDNIAALGFVYQPWQIATYITALRTKPFVILAGVSGTGKSKLPQLVAELTGGHTTRLAVRPDWTDSSEILGYADIQDRFQPGLFAKAAAEASGDLSTHYVTLIDEMNLARVEHYFAEVLSTIEDREPDPQGGYRSRPLFARQSNATYGEWSRLVIPANLGIVGTVNMDDSSHSFSRKVLDRAFTLELSEVDLSWSSALNPTSEVPAIRRWPIQFWHCPATRLAQITAESSAWHGPAERATALLQQLNECLLRSQLQVGYRTRDEVILFLLNAADVPDAFRTREGTRVDPLDIAILMKVLPRLVGGSAALRSTLLGLMGIAQSGKPFTRDDDADAVVVSWDRAQRPDACEEARWPRTTARLCLMWERLQTEGYTAFWL